MARELAHTWLLEKVTTTDGTKPLRLAAWRADTGIVTFKDSGEARWFDGCNWTDGTYRVSGDTLMVKALMSTKMACFDSGWEAFDYQTVKTYSLSTPGDVLWLVTPTRIYELSRFTRAKWTAKLAETEARLEREQRETERKLEAFRDARESCLQTDSLEQCERLVPAPPGLMRDCEPNDPLCE